MMMFIMKLLGTPAAGSQQQVKEEPARQRETAKAAHWWEIENIDGRNEEHPTYMLPLILSDRDCQQDSVK